MAPRIHRPEPEPEPIKEVLARLFTARGWGRRQDRLHLERAWAEAVGSDYDDKTLALLLDILKRANTAALGAIQTLRAQPKAKRSSR
jgi:hypothetical protein